MSDDSSISAVIQESIAGLEGSDASTASAASAPAPPAAAPATTDTPAGAPAPDPAAATDPAAPATPADGDPAAAADPGKRRDTRIPLARHESTLAAARDEGERKVAAVRQEYEGKLQTANQQLEVLRAMDGDPDVFLDALARADPRYAERLGGRRPGAATAAPPATDPAAAMPAPDARLADGSVGYSPEGLKALLDWHAGLVEDRVAKRFAPLERDHRDRERQQVVAGAVGRARTQLESAATWPGFTEHEDAILQALKADQSLSLEGAYRVVVLPKLRASRDTMRGEILAEINGKPKNAAATVPTGGVPPAAESDDTATIIRAAIAGLQR